MNTPREHRRKREAGGCGVRLRLICGMSVLALVAADCSSSTDAGVKEATAACHYRPAVPGPSSTPGLTSRRELSRYQTAQTEAAKAAAADSRWTNLANSYGVLVADWGYVSSHGWDAQAGAPQMVALANQAEATIRSQCSLANASKA